MEAVLEGLLTLFGIFVVIYLVYYGAMIVLYVLGSLGLYTVAKRREIKHPWMAWVPVLNMWTLGSISDQYRYVTNGKVQSRRKLLFGLQIALVALSIVMYVVSFVNSIQVLLDINMQTMTGGPTDEQQLLQMLSSLLGPMAICNVVSSILSIVLMVFQYICYYDLFASCDPDNKVLYLVLSIFFGFLLPIFVFVCRKKDLGMPPRTDVPVESIPQQTADVWAQSRQTWPQSGQTWEQPQQVWPQPQEPAEQSENE